MAAYGKNYSRKSSVKSKKKKMSYDDDGPVSRRNKPGMSRSKKK